MMSLGGCVAAFCCLVTGCYMAPLFASKYAGQWQFILIWDDRVNFLENDVLQGPWSLQTMYEILTMVRLDVYEPLAWILKLATVKLVGLDAWWVRTQAMVIHFAAGLVLAKASGLLLDLDFLLTNLKRIVGGVDVRELKVLSRRHFYACCLSTVVFLIHPIHVEIVAWPSAQSYTLAALFGNLAILTYVTNIVQKMRKVLKKSTKKRETLAVELMQAVLWGDMTWGDFFPPGLYFCALLSKSASLLLPASFILIDVLLFTKLWPASQAKSITASQSSRYLISRLPSVAICLAFVAVTLASNVEGDLPDIVFLSTDERALKVVTAPAWIFRRFLWPSNIRPHYQLQPGDVSLSNPEYILLLMVSLGAVVLLIWESWLHGLSKHLIALAFFVGMLAPVSGVVQHGMITAGMNRYAYLPSIIVVPYGGCLAARWVLPQSQMIFSGSARAHGFDAPEKEIPGGRKRLEAPSVGASYSVKRQIMMRYIRLVWLLITLTLLSISTSLLPAWRNEASLYEYSLRIDPADWKIYGHRAECLLTENHCAEDATECVRMRRLAYEFAPRGTLKADLYLMQLLITLGQVEEVCQTYLSFVDVYPSSGCLHNNAAVCLVLVGRLDEAKQEFAKALQLREFHNTQVHHQENARAFDEWMEMRRQLVIAEDDVPAYEGKITY